jgi:hypothetical protein
MDYDPEIVLLALVAQRRFGGSTESSLGTFTNNVFDRFNTLIESGAAALNPPLNAPLTPKDRTVIAGLATLFGGVPQDAVNQAILSYRRLFAR